VFFESKKVENCFADAENYEYRITLVGSEFIRALASQAQSIRTNERLRRPSFFASLPNGTRIKGILAKDIIKVGYVPTQAIKQRRAFEQWLRSL
jgi:hypothetical protein